MTSKTYIPLIAVILLGAAAAQGGARGSIASGLKIENQNARRVDTTLRLSADVVLDQVRLGSSRQFYLTPVLEDGAGNTEIFPSLLVNGKAMQIAYERGTLSVSGSHNHIVGQAVRRKNGKAQTVEYNASVPLEQWMWGPEASVRWDVDTCGCGTLLGSRAGDSSLLNLNPAGRMRVPFITPPVTPLPVSISEGKAMVKFEVSRSELHDTPYKCRNGQMIDNRSELKVIDDSIAKALSDKNVEIAKIRVCGYASPEGSYSGNERLSTDRSRALSLYIAKRYSLPADRSEYDAVPENWVGFRRQVVESRDLSETQRRNLLELIDRPAYGPSDWDDKERELKTSSKLASLYKSMIHPDWFPQLRATTFEISTRLKPLSDEELAEVLKRTPEKMSLNQMFRVAKLYPEGSEEFNNVIETALKYYPDDEVANLNAASAALRKGELDRAGKLLEKAGNSNEAMTARGILATWQGDLKGAENYFKQAGALPEAAKNLELLKGE